MPKKTGKPKVKRAAHKAAAKPKGSTVTGGYHVVVDKTLAGQEDAEYTTMVFETTSAFTNTAGAASYLQIYGNSIYQPYPGVSSSPAGYQRMYTQYLTSTVIEAKCEVMVWGGSTAAIPEPFRIIVLPCLPAQYTIYSAYSNISSLAGVPHAAQAVFSPGAKIPRLTARGSNATILYGESKTAEAAELTTTDFGAQNGARPTQLWYFLVGYQNFAGTTTTNQQAQVKLTYKVKWTRPIATAQQSLTLDFFGNEYHTAPAKQGAGAGIIPSNTKTDAESKVERKTVRLTQAEAFEDWSDVDSEFASFKEQCAKRRKSMQLAQMRLEKGAPSTADSSKIAGGTTS